MHTIMVVIGGGFLLLAAFAVSSRLGRFPLANAALWFIPVWLLAAAFNLYVGVTTAGYTVLQELPIMLVVFGVPAAAALLLRWRFPAA